MIDTIKELTVRNNFTVSNLTKEMSKWVKENTKYLDSEISLKERVYILINGDSEAICSNGNRKNFKSYKQGYKFCGSARTCKCFRDNSALFMTDFMKNMDDKELVRRVDKIKETVSERYGVDNAFQYEKFKQKSKDTNKENYGVEYSSQSPEFRQNVSNTVMEKYGVDNILKSTYIQQKIKNTNMERYGVENCWELPKQYIPSDTYVILKDIEKFKLNMSKNSITELAKNLGVSNATISAYCRLYDIDIPSSTYEHAIVDFLRQNNIIYQLHNRQIIKPQEIDIVLPDYKLGIEFCGLYWHSEKNIKDKNYHLSKLQKTNEAGYRLITIFEDEWLYKRDIVERKLLNLVGIQEQGNDTDSLSIKQLSFEDSKEFLEKYHIQGCGNSSGYIGYGAYDNDELVVVMTFSNNELVRFSTNGKKYPGISSRLLNSFIRDYNPKQIVGYSDRRWNVGNLYTQLGFEKIDETAVRYWCVKGNQRYNNFDNLIMEEIGYSRIWDCGNIKFILNLE